MRAVGNSLAAVVLALVAVAVAAPILISLSHALVPVLIVAIVGAADSGFFSSTPAAGEFDVHSTS